MRTNSELHSVLAVLVAAAISGCEAPPTQVAPSSDVAKSNASALRSSAPFPVWHQGFERDTEGWYGAETEGELGWCGSIRRKTGRPGAVRPSKGRGLATVAGGPCNELWTTLGVPFGGPYGPGPDQSLYSRIWPASGYVTALDIYLDPAWSEAFPATFPWTPGRLIDYGATIFLLAPEPGSFHTGPHYLAPVDSDGEGALSVFGYRVTRAGWYTFRFVFSADAGEVRVDFELADRSGRTLLVEPDLPPVELVGPIKLPFEGELRTSDYGSGHVWFFDVAEGLELPIDGHRVRRGR